MVSLFFQIQEFFTETLWSKLPDSWQEALTVVDLSELARLLLGRDDMDACNKYTTHTNSLINDSCHVLYSPLSNKMAPHTHTHTHSKFVSKVYPLSLVHYPIRWHHTHTHTASLCLRYTPCLYWPSLLLPTHSHCHGNPHHQMGLFHE